MYAKEIENIDRQIEELYIKRAGFEMKAEAKRKEEENKKKEEKRKDFESIQSAIQEYNKKYSASLILGEEQKIEGRSIHDWFPWW